MHKSRANLDPALIEELTRRPIPLHVKLRPPPKYNRVKFQPPTNLQILPVAHLSPVKNPSQPVEDRKAATKLSRNHHPKNASNLPRSYVHIVNPSFSKRYVKPPPNTINGFELFVHRKLTMQTASLANPGSLNMVPGIPGLLRQGKMKNLLRLPEEYSSKAPESGRELAVEGLLGKPLTKVDGKDVPDSKAENRAVTILEPVEDALEEKPDPELEKTLVKEENVKPVKANKKRSNSLPPVLQNFYFPKINDRPMSVACFSNDIEKAKTPKSQHRQGRNSILPLVLRDWVRDRNARITNMTVADSGMATKLSWESSTTMVRDFTTHRTRTRSVLGRFDKSSIFLSYCPTGANEQRMIDEVKRILQFYYNVETDIQDMNSSRQLSLVLVCYNKVLEESFSNQLELANLEDLEVPFLFWNLEPNYVLDTNSWLNIFIQNHQDPVLEFPFPNVIRPDLFEEDINNLLFQLRQVFRRPPASRRRSSLC